MISLNLKDFNEIKPYQKNVLYKINRSVVVPVKEMHEEKNNYELVNLVYDLNSRQYGIFAHEYRNPVVLKQGCKTADVLSCVIDNDKKQINTFIFDVKSNISAFSDDLRKDNAILTAIKEVRDFTEQVHAEILHKNSFMLYYKDEGFFEEESVGLVTKRFEKEKFIAAANMLEALFEEDNSFVSTLLDVKLKNILRPYKNEIGRIRDFSERKIKIGDEIYHLKVIILEKESESIYAATINIPFRYA